MKTLKSEATASPRSFYSHFKSYVLDNPLANHGPVSAPRSSGTTMKLILLALVLFARAPGGQACTCPTSTFEQQYARARTVVQALLVRETKLSTPAPEPCSSPGPCVMSLDDRPVVYLLQVLRIFKGCGPANLLFFAKSNLGPGFCGLSLQEGKEYMLNLGRAKRPRPGVDVKTFNVSSCQGNRLFEKLAPAKVRFLEKMSKEPVNQCSTR